MKVFFTILSVLWIICDLHAQSFAPLGAEWHYCEGEVFAPDDIGYLKITVTKDTIIGNHVCRELEVDWLCWHPSGKQYVYTSQDSVFLFDPALDRFKLIYAFDAVPGDSIIIPVIGLEDGLVDTVIVSIISTGTILINNITLRHQFVTYRVIDTFPSGVQEFSYSSEIAELIGDIYFVFAFPEEASRVCDANFSCGLRCYEDSYLGHYETGEAENCTYTFVAVNEPNINELGLYPNPTYDRIYLEPENENFKAIDLLDNIGRTVRKFSLSEEIDLSALIEGIYFLRLIDNQNNYYIEKVIKYGR